KLTDCSGVVLSAATCAAVLNARSFSLGLWHSTHISIWFRFSPCSDNREWHWLHLSMLTTVRRGVTGEPSTEKYVTLLVPPYSVACSRVVPGRIVRPRRPSIPMAYVPEALAGIECAKVYVQVPSGEHLAVGTGFSETYPGVVTLLPKLV